MALRNRTLKIYVSVIFSLTIMIGSFFQPLLGLAVPFLLLAAIVGSFSGRKWFCAQACPRANILSGVVSRFSLYRELPAFLYSKGVRNAGCAFLMICSLGQTARLWPDFKALGSFFWMVCVLTFVLSITLGLFFKPRSWCAMCPLGTLQGTISKVLK